MNTLEKICQGQHLTIEQSFAEFSEIVTGKSSAIEIAAFLTALKSKGETIDEIMGAIQAMRQVTIPFPQAQELKQNFTVVDCCGTGGDGQQTLNISTAVGILLACTGITVAKHGNRAVSSQCGSADLLEFLGVKLEVSAQDAANTLKKVGINFLFAPFYHPGARFAKEVRSTLKVRTIFNILGPLLNPIQPDYQLIGVYTPELCKPFAQVLQLLGLKRALVVHGSGLDELAVHGPTTGCLLKDGFISDFYLTPHAAGLANYPLHALKGGETAHNAQALLDLLQGKGSAAFRASVSLNAGAMLWLIDKAISIADGVEIIQKILDGNQGFEKLQQLIEVSNAQ